MNHVLKTWPPYFKETRNGRKTWELRRDDRGFSEGDALILMEWDPTTSEYTGEVERRLVTYVARGGAIPEGFCCMSVVQPIRVTTRGTEPSR